MADVEMTDAPTSAAVTKKKGGDGEGKEGKKRFEVKKVQGARFPAAAASGR
jgi:RING-box protein 1